MKKSSLFSALLTLSLFSLGHLQAWAQTPPVILSSSPAFGDTQVDPSLKEIIIHFDQKMGSGMSIVNSANAPKTTGSAQWVNDSTFRIPVSLKPNTTYSLNLNNSRYRNFRSAEGISMQPQRLVFSTKRLDQSRKVQKASFEAFEQAFTSLYSYYDSRGIDWQTELALYKPKLMQSETASEFATHLIAMLEKADDPHLWVELYGDRFKTNTPKLIHQNLNLMAVIRGLTDRKNSKSNWVISGMYGKVGYLAIRTWNNQNKSEILTALDRLKEMRELDHIIIDVRDNSGGNDRIAQEFASHFIKESVEFEKIVTYNEETEKFDRTTVRKLQPSQDFYYPGKVYVLTGKSIMSSNESFVMMMQQAPNVTTIGMSTFGTSGNPRPFNLPNGIMVYLPSWQAYTIDDQLIEGKGLSPDIEFITKDGDFAAKDVLVEKVISLIEKGN